MMMMLREVKGTGMHCNLEVDVVLDFLGAFGLPGGLLIPEEEH